MEIIYLDEVFLIDLAADYLLCLLTARLCSLPLHRGRYFAAAVLGAVYSAAALLPGLGFLRGGSFRLLTGILMAALSFAGCAHMLRCCIVFFALSAAFGGAVTALCGYGGISLPTLAVCFCLCLALISLAFRASEPDRKRCRVRLEVGTHAAEFAALIDTGNSLRDPVSGKHVMLVSRSAAAVLFPECAELFALNDGVRLTELLAQSDACRGKFRLIPCSTVTGSMLLPLFTPDRVSVDGREETLLAAVSPVLCEDGFDAII